MVAIVLDEAVFPGLPVIVAHSSGEPTSQGALELADAELIDRKKRGGEYCLGCKGVKRHGSAGLFTLAEPEMSRAVLAPKVASLAQARPRVVATGNPGCLMQLGAGLAAAGVPASVRHPVELLDESYRAAGYYA